MWHASHFRKMENYQRILIFHVFSDDCQAYLDGIALTFYVTQVTLLNHIEETGKAPTKFKRKIFVCLPISFEKVFWQSSAIYKIGTHCAPPDCLSSAIQNLADVKLSMLCEQLLMGTAFSCAYAPKIFETKYNL